LDKKLKSTVDSKSSKRNATSLVEFPCSPIHETLEDGCALKNWHTKKTAPEKTSGDQGRFFQS